MNLTDYLQPFLGGTLIGLAALLLMMTIGKIAGISGIFYQTISNKPSSVFWQWFFILGLIVSSLLITPLDFSLPSSFQGSLPTLAIAGFLVGLGTKIGSGCTSGHGICGIGRLSKRSIVATCTFMLVAATTVFLTRLYG